MITGFRWHNGGAQKLYGVVPDLAPSARRSRTASRSPRSPAGASSCASAGSSISTSRASSCCRPRTAPRRTRLPRRSRPCSVYQQRAGHRPSLPAGRASAAAGRGGHRAARSDRASSRSSASHAACSTRRSDQGGAPSQAFRTLFLQETIRRGVLMPSLVVSYAHTDEDIDRTVGGDRRRPRGLRQALDQGVERHLVGRPSQVVYRRHNQPDGPPEAAAAAPENGGAALTASGRRSGAALVDAVPAGADVDRGGNATGRSKARTTSSAPPSGRRPAPPLTRKKGARARGPSAVGRWATPIVAPNAPIGSLAKRPPEALAFRHRRRNMEATGPPQPRRRSALDASSGNRPSRLYRHGHGADAA